MYNTILVFCVLTLYNVNYINNKNVKKMLPYWLRCRSVHDKLISKWMKNNSTLVFVSIYCMCMDRK